MYNDRKERRGGGKEREREEGRREGEGARGGEEGRRGGEGNALLHSARSSPPLSRA